MQKIWYEKSELEKSDKKCMLNHQKYVLYERVILISYASMLSACRSLGACDFEPYIFAPQVSECLHYSTLWTIFSFVNASLFCGIKWVCRKRHFSCGIKVCWERGTCCQNLKTNVSTMKESCSKWNGCIIVHIFLHFIQNYSVICDLYL